MDNEKLIEDLRGLLKQYGEKIPYGELVGAPWPYSRSGDLVWQDPEPYFIEQAATALSTLQAENEKLRNEVERQRRSADDRKHLYENAERAYMKVVAELEQVKLAARNDIPHNCHTCMDKSDPTCPGNKRTNSFGYQENCEKWTWRGPQKED